MNNLVKVILIQLMLTTACSKSGSGVADNDDKPDTTVENGIVKGRITDSKGLPLAHTKVVIEHTVYYGTYAYATSDNNGYYRTSIPQGSWQASVQLSKNYHGQLYTFDLHPDNAASFPGTTGAVRNFAWKLSGAKPNGGFYGSYVAVYPEPGSAFSADDIVLTLTPDGPLADGSAGQVITRELTDIGGGEDGIADVPVGRYTITAKSKSTAKPLLIRKRNTGSYSPSYSGIFSSGFTGSTSYQIVLQVK